MLCFNVFVEKDFPLVNLKNNLKIKLCNTQYIFLQFTYQKELNVAFLSKVVP